eukprot:m51a1_g8645 hypothetical protein (434) ;mRNA; f:12921-14578
MGAVPDAQAALSIQLTYRCWKASRELSRRVRAHVMRFKVASEIATSEAVYAQGLRVLMSAFATPSRRALGSHFDEIFGGVPAMLALSTELLEQLTARLFSWTPQQALGDIVGAFVPKMIDAYRPYVSTYDQRVAALERLRQQRKAFNDAILQGTPSAPAAAALLFLCTSERPECKGLKVGSFLILPVQRGPRYALLIRELLKYTREDHPDYPRVAEALHLAECSMRQLNEATRAAEVIGTMRRNVVHVEKLVRGFDDDSQFLREGDAVEVLPDSRTRSVYLYAFRGIVVVAEQLHGRDRLRTVLSGKLKHKLSCLAAVHVGEALPLEVSVPGSLGQLRCAAVSIEDTKRRHHVFGFLSAQLRDVWLAVFRESARAPPEAALSRGPQGLAAQDSGRLVAEIAGGGNSNSNSSSSLAAAAVGSVLLGSSFGASDE